MGDIIFDFMVTFDEVPPSRTADGKIVRRMKNYDEKLDINILGIPFKDEYREAIQDTLLSDRLKYKDNNDTTAA